MTREYDDIIDLPHHVSTRRPQMTAINRAAQFAPFAALTGHDAAIKETARLTEKRLELDEYMKENINHRLQIIADRIKDHPKIKITYFQPDERKNGGAYISLNDTVKKIDQYEGIVLMTNKREIPIDEIISIEGEIFNLVNLGIKNSY